MAPHDLWNLNMIYNISWWSSYADFLRNNGYYLPQELDDSEFFVAEGEDENTEEWEQVSVESFVVYDEDDNNNIDDIPGSGTREDPIDLTCDETDDETDDDVSVGY